MTKHSTLLNDLYFLRRGDLDNALFLRMEVSGLLARMAHVRLDRLSMFWTDWQTNANRSSLNQATAGFVTGLYGQSCPWFFALNGSPSEIECWFGVDRESMNEATLTSLLRSAFLDPHLIPAEKFALSQMDRLPLAHMLTGTPSAKLDENGNPLAEQIEKLCRGLFGGRWSYLVYSEPVAGMETVREVNKITNAIRDAQSNYLLKGSAIDEQNRSAQMYVDLLEAKLHRFEEGCISGMWRVQCFLFTDSPAHAALGQHLLQSAFSGEDSRPDPVRVRQCSLETQEMPQLEPVTSEELAVLTRPPSEDYPGYELTEYARFGVEPTHPASENAIEVGDIMDRGDSTGNTLAVSRESLTMHALIAGITGSGKTNTCFSLLAQIWNGGQGVPFLVVESAKSEYRQLLNDPKFRGMQVFTVGDDTVSPLRLNPFEVPPNILVQTHIDYIKSLFAAAFVLYPPMPYVLEQSIQEIYADRGWNVAANTNTRGADSPRAFPSLSDLAAKIGVVIDRMGYDQRITMDVKAGLLARIDQLRLGGGKGLMFSSRNSVSASVLFEAPCLLELKQLVSDDEKAFLIGLILIRLHEYHESRQKSHGKLVHVTLIEEAHRLLRNVSTEQGNEVSANPRGRAIEVFSNVLSEIRAYGEGILMAEQIPVKLAPDAVKNTSLKIIHRLVSRDDRELVGSTANLDDIQMRRLSTLAAGDAIAWTENSRKPVFVHVPLALTKRTVENVSPETLRTAMDTFWRNNSNLMRPFADCVNCSAVSSHSFCTEPQCEATDQPLHEAFLHLFNAMRLNSDVVVDSFKEFVSLTQRSSQKDRMVDPYCSFVHLLEPELERRGEFRGWPFEDVGAAISMACAIFDSLLGLSKVPKPSDPDWRSKATEFQVMLRRLERFDAGPYPGCHVCSSCCVYRFDMDDDCFGIDFRAAFHSAKENYEKLIEICRDVAARHFVYLDKKSFNGAVLCFAVQQFARNEMQWNSGSLTKFLKTLRSHIAVRK